MNNGQALTAELKTLDPDVQAAEGLSEVLRWLKGGKTSTWVETRNVVKTIIIIIMGYNGYI